MRRAAWMFGGVLVAVAAVWVTRQAPRRLDQPTRPEVNPVVWLQETQQPTKKKGAGKKKKAAAADAVESKPLDEATGVEAILSSGDSYDDWVSVAQTSDGTLYAAYAAYYDAHDQIRLHKQLPDGNWSTRTYVPLVKPRADIWMPQIACDSQDRVWVIWSEQTDQTRTASGNWDLYARALDEKKNEWGPLVRLTDHAKPDINLHVTTDAQRNIHVVWQGHPENSGDVMYCRYDGKDWTRPITVTSGPESDWYPQVAVDKSGVAWIAFDSYRNGDYDVFLTSVTGDKAGEVRPIATSKFYEAHASVACTHDGRVWVAWEQGGFNWGKDQGHWLNINNKQRGTTLGNTRSVKIAAVDTATGMLLAGPAIEQALGEVEPKITAMAGLSSDSEGRLWLRFRKINRGVLGARGQFRRYWTENVTYLTSSGWAAARQLPASAGRISVFSRQMTAKDGRLLVAYSGDQRETGNPHQPVHDRALVAVLPKPELGGLPKLAEYVAPSAPDNLPAWNADEEREAVGAARAHRIRVGDSSLQIVRGDLHRHTELSWDVGPGNDGSYLDFYRYMIDVAAMDFGGLTDHQGGGHYAYHWWLTEKSSDLYYLAPRFVPLYGYERSARFPDGHRNIFHSYRGVPVFPFQVKTNLTGEFPGVGAGDLRSNDTKLLYQYLHNSGGVAISHTSGTDSMGTDWRDNDPEIEPVVEIYQGVRNSYEVVGGPRVHDVTKMTPAQAPGGYQEAGMVWNALTKGYRLGTTASSDHGSTHISYSMVYTKANDRESILAAIRQRHTYGATDNLVVESWANGHFMGDEFETTERPSLRLKARGTGPILRVDLIRNNQYIYNSAPEKRDVEISYVDMEAKPGLNYYYFRIVQEDGQVAWASPMWVNLRAG